MVYLKTRQTSTIVFGHSPSSVSWSASLGVPKPGLRMSLKTWAGDSSPLD